MILPDNNPDSILIYTDWLIDNNQEELALEIREEAGVSDWFYENRTLSLVGCLFEDRGISNVGSSLYHGEIGGKNLPVGAWLGGNIVGEGD